MRLVPALAALILPAAAFADRADVVTAPDPLEQTLASGAGLDEVTDLGALVDRATDGLRGKDRRRVAAQVRESALDDLASSIRAAGDRVRCIDPGPDRAVYRFLDARGSLDYLFVELGGDGRISDWMWLSEGVLASERLLGRIVGSAPGEAGVDVSALERAIDAGDWTAFDASIDAIEAAGGSDPWLVWLRGVSADARGRDAEARLRMAAAEALDPTLVGQVFAPGHGG